MTAGPVPQVASPLTHRETEVLRAVADGHTMVAIARHAHMSESAARDVMRCVREKLHAATAAQAVHRAHQLGVLS